MTLDTATTRTLALTDNAYAARVHAGASQMSVPVRGTTISNDI